MTVEILKVTLLCVAGGQETVLGGQHLVWANDLDAEEMEMANMSPLPRHTRYRAYRLKDETPLDVRQILAGCHNVMQHGGRTAEKVEEAAHDETAAEEAEDVAEGGSCFSLK